MFLNSFFEGRRSLRLKGYKYYSLGAYFLTICAKHREPLFGEIAGGEMWLNEFGAIVGEEWNRTGEVRKSVELDELVIMPNHIHGIIWIVNDVGATRRVAPTELARGPQQGSIGAIMAQFKSWVTKRINDYRGTPDGVVWQRNYYDRIIRDDSELRRIRRYIQDNPRNWAEDPENFIPYR